MARSPSLQGGGLANDPGISSHLPTPLPLPRTAKGEGNVSYEVTSGPGAGVKAGVLIH